MSKIEKNWGKIVEHKGENKVTGRKRSDVYPVGSAFIPVCGSGSRSIK